MKVACSFCGNFFKTSHQGKYCSVICYKVNRTNKIAKVNCINCGVQFNQCRENRKYCSIACFAEHRTGKMPELTPFQISVVNGLLLGDGCIGKATIRNCRLGIVQLRFDYLNDLYEIMRPHFLPIFKSRSKKIIQAYYLNEKRKLLHSDIEYNEYYRLDSHCHKMWTALRQRWYTDGKKEVPFDIKFDAITLAHWYMGDGCYSSLTGQIYLATNSFSEKSMQLICQKLDNVGINNFIVKDKSGFRTYIAKRCCANFIDIVRPYMSECFYYKLF